LVLKSESRSKLVAFGIELMYTKGDPARLIGDLNDSAH
jgi:hypothetical protein